MKAHFLRGSKQQIADDLARISGDVRKAIVFVDESASAPDAQATDSADIFAEMRPFMVDVPAVDDSRAAIYSPAEGE